MGKFSDTIEQKQIATEVEGVLQKLAQVQGDLLARVSAIVDQLSAARARIIASELFDEADVADFDAIAGDAVRDALAAIKAKLNATTLLSSKVAMQIDGVEVP